MSMSLPADFPALSGFLEPLLGWLAFFSLITFILSLVLIPLVVGRLSEDCFLKLYHNDRSGPPPTVGSVILLILRHGLGIVLVLSGIAMLFLPGQGLLTIILGTLLFSFPGKQRLIDSMVRQPKIRKSLNWLRKKRHKPPFQWPKLPDNRDT
jgi:hypothetical protein